MEQDVHLISFGVFNLVLLQPFTLIGWHSIQTRPVLKVMEGEMLQVRPSKAAVVTFT